MELRRSTLRTLMIVILILLGMTIGAIAQEVSVTTDQLQIAEAASRAGSSRLSPDDLSAIIAYPEDIIVDGRWAYGIAVERALEGEHGSPWLYLYLARYLDRQWIVAYETEPIFQEWLLSAPSLVMSNEMKSVLHQSGEGGAAGDGSAQLSLPWKTGDKQFFTRSLHTGVMTNVWSDPTGKAALDFSGGVGEVRSARDGVVIRSANCLNFVRVNHADGWSTGYYHMPENSINVNNGDTISREQYIGNQGMDIGCGGTATGNHLHFIMAKNSTPQSWDGMDLGGWTISASANSLTRIRDGIVRTVGNEIENDGAVGSGVMPAPANTNLVRNGDFASGGQYWTPAGDIDVEFTGGVARMRRTGTTAGSWEMPQVLNYSAAAGQVFEGSIQLQNTSSAAREIIFSIGITSSPFTSMGCIFTLPANSPLRTYTLRGALPAADWSNMRVVLVPRDVSPTRDIVADNVSIMYKPSLSVSGTECISTAPANTNLVRNGDFSSGSQHWAPAGDIDVDFTGGVARMRRTGTTAGSWEMPQVLNYSAAAGQVFEGSIQLQNTSSAARQIIFSIGITTSPFTSMGCGFILPPNSPLQTYNLRGALPAADWSNMRVVLVPGDVSATRDIVADNVSVMYKPSLSVSGTECISTAPANTNLVRNGDFANGGQHWAPAGDIDVDFTGGIARMRRTGTTAGSWEMPQVLNYSAATGQVFEGSIQLENTSTAEREIIFSIGITTSPFTSMGCVFTLPANSSLQTYTLRGALPSADWSNMRVVLVPRDVSPTRDIVTDNISVMFKPGSSASETECIEPNIITEGATLALIPGTTVTAVDGTFDIVVRVEAGSLPINGVAAHLNFDPALLSVEQITPGSLLPTILQNDFDNATGTLNFASGTFSNPPTGTFTAATIRFRALAPTLQTSLTFASVDPRKTDITSNGASVLSAVQEAVVTINDTSVEVTVGFQGRPTAPNNLLILPVRVIVKNTITGVVVYNNEVTTDQYAHFTLTGLLPGTYQIWIKNSRSLAVIQTLTVVGGAQTLTTGMLRMGDANDNNSVTLVDFSLLATTYGKVQGNVGYDASSDFNGDNVVNLVDFSLLASNYGQAGAPTP